MVESLKKSGFSEKAIDYYIHKVNVGILKDASISFSYTGHCGDTMTIYLKIEFQIITDAKLEVIGCAGAFSAGSALMQMIKGLSVSDARTKTENDIFKHLMGMPVSKTDCATLAITSLRKTIDSYTAEQKAVNTQ